MLTYEMVYGEPPFRITNPQQMSLIVSEKIHFPKMTGASPLIMELMKDCLEKNVKQRPTAKLLLNHEFFTSSSSRMTIG